MTTPKNFCFQRALLLRDRYVKEDLDDLDKFRVGRQDSVNQFIRSITMKNLFYYMLSIKNLFAMKYVKDSIKMEEMGFRDNMIDKFIYSSGIALNCNANSSDLDSYLYSFVISAPLLTNVTTFSNFSALFFNWYSRFLQFFVIILYQIPLIILYIDTNNRMRFLLSNMALLLALKKENNVYMFDWDFNFRNFLFSSGALINDLPAEVANVVPTLDMYSNTVIAKGLVVKAYKDWDEHLTSGFAVVNLVDNANVIDWFDDHSGYNSPQRVDGYADYFKTRLAYILVDKYNVSRNRVFDRNLGVDTSKLKRRGNMPIYGNNLLNAFNGIRNPFAVFASCNEEDFSTFALLVVNFLPVYRKVNEGLNENEEEQTTAGNYTFIGALIEYIYSKQKEIYTRIKFSRVANLFNECIARKMFRVDRMIGYNFLKSTSDFAFVYVVPLKNCSYSYKLYLKRDFFEFFKFFDNVYYRPKFLAMLTDEGLSLLKHLSKFDSNVIDAFGAEVVKTQNLLNR